MNPNIIFDDHAAALHRIRALKIDTPGTDFLMRRAADDLAERVAAVDRRFPRAVSLFSATDHAARVLLACGKCDSVDRIEAVDHLPGNHQVGAIASPDCLPLAYGTVNLAVSLLSMHHFNDLPGFLAQVVRSLQPDGLFLAALPAAGTLSELRESLLAAESEIDNAASPRILPFADVRQLGSLLQRARFALPVADVDTVTVRYDTMFDLIGDLRAMAATNILVERSRKPPGRNMFARAAQIYADRFSDADGRIRATFSIAWLSGWCPHDSQQKPARRGSATASLTDILGGKR